MHDDFFPTHSDSVIYDREYSISARLHIPVDYSMSSRRFFYLSDCVARDIKREKEELEKIRQLKKSKAGRRA